MKKAIDANIVDIELFIAKIDKSSGLYPNFYSFKVGLVSYLLTKVKFHHISKKGLWDSTLAHRYNALKGLHRWLERVYRYVINSRKTAF